MGSLIPVVFSLLLLVSACEGQVARVRDSPVTCSDEGIQCEVISDNVIDAVLNIDTLMECRQLCLDDANCQFISYFDDNAAPLPHFCQLFNSCESVAPCSDCVSENMQCFDTCGSSVVGDLIEATDVLPNVESEAACQQSCSRSSACSYYTYFTTEDAAYPGFCFLLARLRGPVTSCASCYTGPRQCDNECSLDNAFQWGDHRDGVMLTNTSDTEVIWVNGYKCELTYLLVGGGHDSAGHGYMAGGGSGYLEYGSKLVSAGTVLTGQVGAQQQASELTLSSGDTLTAPPGQDSPDGALGRGGDGFSGGGGNGGLDRYRYGQGGRGGSNGGDGHGGFEGTEYESHNGGSGSGEDVSLYTFTSWTLAPGAGGSNNGGGGGGGGGVLVNGEGPERSVYQGQGFGGGGNGYSGYGDGLQGVILLEVTPV